MDISNDQYASNGVYFNRSLEGNPSQKNIQTHTITMSSFLFRSPATKRVPLVRYSARTKRENRIQVQLLKDFPEYGAKGEIIEVLPGLMRNKLYPQNGAAYIIPRMNLGPKIPVVTREEIRAREEEKIRIVQAGQLAEQEARLAASAAKKQAIKEQATKESKPLSIKGLLFKQSTTSTASGNITSSAGEYSLIALETKLPAVITFQTIPQTKSTILSEILKLTNGISVQASELQLFKGKESVEEFSEKGQFKIVIEPEFAQGEKISKKIIIQ
ncbi:hypothetical protein WICPIJ_007772 [Wickerhamomyces pijperi]|uniref:Ribosomal protein L9 domain-containing protein n=1 Tax=Wickerhamomyces pijperi TaxID=599730 RepID=A0A9P8Q118_WICPI|nr:hypothetical protein WICPIJ_007772 [Wickerhamomyces pijperi]